MGLSFERVTKRFGALVAVEDVSLVAEPGRITSIIGPNGAGKSTLVNMAAGSYRVSTGRILLDGAELQSLPKHRVARAGLGRTYQNIRLFDGLTVLENLEVALAPASLGGLLADALLPGNGREMRRERCRATLQAFGLAALADRPAASLSYGNQKLVELSRAVVARPRVVLMDEPAAGLNHGETEELRHHIAALRRADVALVLIEHDMNLVMSISDRIVVLHRGRLLAHGTPAEVQADPQVQEAYLGKPGGVTEAARARRDRVRLRAHHDLAWHPA
jgi:branched-chain amino acid transport system ATP-binding protein